jgi:hypothetical protein
VLIPASGVGECAGRASEYYREYVNFLGTDEMIVHETDREIGAVIEILKK